MTADDAVPILAQWVRHLQTENSQLRIENEHLRRRAQLAADIRWWMEKHTPTEVLELAQAVG